jgi:hypothetical protein
LLGFRFNREGCGDMFHRKFGSLQPDYVRVISQDMELFITTIFKNPDPTFFPLNSHWAALL